MYSTLRRLINYCLIIIALLNPLSRSLAQVTYYVATTGSDGNDGRSGIAPLRSLSRVNQLNLQAGDSVLFRRGDTFSGTLLLRKSGTLARPIFIGAYGQGAKPTLTGGVPVKNWSNVGNNRWQASCPDCGDRITGVYRNGVTSLFNRIRQQPNWPASKPWQRTGRVQRLSFSRPTGSLTGLP